MSGLKHVYGEHLLFIGIKCSKSHWDYLNTVNEVFDTTFLYYGFVRILKKVHDSETLWSGLLNVHNKSSYFNARVHR